MRAKLNWGLYLGAGLLAVCLAGCGGNGTATPVGNAPAAGDLRVEVDGSSTVYVLSQAVTEEFAAEDDEADGKVNVTVKSSGTGGGFKRFVAGELDITGASRPIKTEEIELAEKNGVEYIELPVCFDALTVAVPIANDWVDSITVAELKSIWESAAEGKIMKWNQVPGHEGDWPDHELALFGAGPDSGTFEYFTEAICKEKGNHRKDYGGNENDNVIITNIEGDKYAMGYIPFAYYEPHQAKLKALKIDWKADDEQGPVAPSIDNVIKGIYNPLARPLFIYVNRKSADKPGVQQYVDFYLENAAALAKDVQYIPLPADAYSTVKKRWSDRKTGTVFGGKAAVGLQLEDIVKSEG
jgi:phosphate transport system substrate-binding protein